jgi:hypothetical protein
METSAKVKEIRQCNCTMCKATRARSKSFSRWGSIRASYRDSMNAIVKGGDPENYNKNLMTRDYDA